MTNLANAMSFDDVLAEIKKLGGMAGSGAGARANFLMKAVEGAARGALDTDTKTVIDGKKIDHAEQLYRAYTQAYGQKNAHNDKTIAAKASNVRKAIELGVTKGDVGLDTVREAARRHASIEDTDIKKSAFEALNSVIRAQLESATPLTPEAIDACILKGEAKEAKPKDAAHYLERASKELEKAFEASKDGRVEEAYQQVRELLTAFATAAERAEKLAAIAKLQAELAA